jgi:peptide/nickel transport system substrate-binding protein
MVGNWFRNSRAVAYTALTLIILAAVACGSASAPADTAPAPAVPAAAEQAAVPAPDKAAAPAPAAAAPVAPTAVPKTMAEPAEAMAEVHPGKLTWMIASFGNERFEYLVSRGTGHDMARILHGFMISSDIVEGKREFAPGILTDWAVSEDGLNWMLTVREGVKFHDGTDLTAEDVTWSLQHNIGPQAVEHGGTQTLAFNMDRIEQTGPNNVSVTTKAVHLDLAERISDASGVWFGAVFPKRTALHDDELEKAYDRNPIGAGAMKFVKHVPVELMSFERFDDYYHQPENGFSSDKRVNFTELDLRLVPEEATRVAALRAGETDIAPVTLGAREQVEAGGGRLVFGQEGVVFQPRISGCWNRPGRLLPCDDKGVRQALQYALDKELIRDRLFGEEVLEVKGWTVVTPSTIGYSPGLDPFPFDPDKARQLMTEAGYKTPTNPEGKDFGKLIINTWVSTSSPLMVESAQLASEMWRKELGIDAEVRVGEEAALKKASSLTEDLHGEVLWRDNEARIDASGTVANNFGNPERISRMSDDPEVIALTQEVSRILDLVEREKALRERLYPRLRDEAYWISIGYINIAWGVGSQVATWDPYPLAFYPSALHTITLK